MQSLQTSCVVYIDTVKRVQVSLQYVKSAMNIMIVMSRLQF